MRNTWSLAVAMFLVGATGLALCGCHTSHDIHITLDINYIESSVSDQSGRTRQIAMAPPSGMRAEGEQTTPIVQISDAEKNAVENRRARLRQVQDLKALGNVGEDCKGFLAIPPIVRQRMSAEERTKAAQVLDAENLDRLSIYQNVAQRYGIGSSSPQPGEYWAETFRGQAKPGEWLQVPVESAFFRSFLSTPLGECLAPEAKIKGQWVRVPARYHAPEPK
jgi:hypothetical protein